MTTWIRFRDGDGRIGFGTLDPHSGRVVQHDGALFDRPRPTDITFAADDLTLLAPCEPSKIVALWNNYYALSQKLDKAPPQHPLFLIKPPMSVIGPNEAIRRPRSYHGKIAYEGELGIVIGKTVSGASVEEAEEAIFGYTCVNDVTAIELLQEDPNFAQWCRSKGFDTFTCLGPAIVAGFDWRSATLTTTVEGVERQNYPLDDMIFSPAEQVSLISHDMTLVPGDVIACGTSVGVGSIRDGARVDVSIAGIGTLSNVLAV
ncbi:MULTISPECIES: fumarylacetoacetate hydrolase family protein [unclassified Caballeronia]|uniref:fumarylacetoacetate hydrolase family protein n=1 Tax=unclassified Caballeronia TaxID=2646786 RepID=UPI002858D9A7|nr:MULTISPECIES: fumarylacetoacetate hydrolase family protein [unclassified Caballeronia]MDR5739877.1 fumarylacetoacetate hydrolase family protein [Caballeronia sp. LZ016]MDR5808342.1 fumarylacetoacetate hydrolase family protein [Caballeronia sp. LZ019]